MLILHHPNLASLTCDDCKKWVYDFKERRFHLSGGKPVPRPAGSALPCWQCPKCDGVDRKSPDEGRKAELSPKNQRALQAYYEGEKGDRITARLFGIIRRVTESYDRQAIRVLCEIIAGRP